MIRSSLRCLWSVREIHNLIGSGLVIADSAIDLQPGTWRETIFGFINFTATAQKKCGTGIYPERG